MYPKSIRTTLLCLGIAVCAIANSQDTLTLDEALRLARLNNGDIRAAAFDVRAANARVNQAKSAFYPTVTPFAQYGNRRTVTDIGTGSQTTTNDGFTTGVDARWNVLDSGQKEFSLLSSRRNEDATKFDATQLLRRTLFQVHQQYYEALRAQELLRVAQSQVDRTQKIYDQAEFGARPEIGSVAKKDVYQARADLLNAKVELLRVKNLTSNTVSTLKATIGWDQSRELPMLARVAEPTEFAAPEPKEKVVADGLSDRADLQASRRRLDAQYYSVKRADRDAGFSFDLDLNYSRNFSPNQNDDRNLTLLVSYPLFDGGRLREQAREQKLIYQSAQASLVQTERIAQAEIESAYSEYVQNIERVNASKQALEAAQVNYDAAIAAQREGANDVIEVLTAQVSLVTAESNYIEATYDYYVAGVNLRLVSGRSIPGELER
ncbi:MAG: TolC family protein [Chlorobia bacterium]|nr:TolC family protein [Fimbriimonadaceae bacterium]